MGRIIDPYGGEVTVSDPDFGDTRLPTKQCVHCGDHWIVFPGSGRIRGFCMQCNGPICGPKCQKCIPQERQLEAREAGADWGEDLPGNPVSGNVPKIWTP